MADDLDAPPPEKPTFQEIMDAYADAGYQPDTISRHDMECLLVAWEEKNYRDATLRQLERMWLTSPK